MSDTTGLVRVLPDRESAAKAAREARDTYLGKVNDKADRMPDPRDVAGWWPLAEGDRQATDVEGACPAHLDGVHRYNHRRVTDYADLSVVNYCVCGDTRRSGR